MANDLRQAMENKVKAEELRDAGMKVYTTQELLGELSPDTAAYYSNHKVDLNVVRARFLDDFTNEEFTPDGKRCFKRALDLFVGFFETAKEDIDAYLAENKKK